MAGTTGLEPAASAVTGQRSETLILVQQSGQSGKKKRLSTESKG
jgi:hypothetical protein